MSLVFFAGCAQTMSPAPTAVGIIGGEAAKDESATHSTVAIINTATGLLECTATLIAPHVVLTAGHCVTDQAKDRAVLFSKDIPAKIAPSDLVVASEVRVTDEWKNHGAHAGCARGDLALLRIDGALPPGFAPAEDWATSSPPISSPLHFYGFGLMRFEPRVLPSSMQTVSLIYRGDDGSKTESRFDQSGGKGICNGDSGGPSFVETSPHKWQLYGVNSYTGATCTGPYGYAEVTKVSAYATWLHATTAALELVARSL